MKIPALWAWVFTGPDGEEGIAAVSRDNIFLPLIGADYERMDAYRPAAQAVADETGRTVVLVQFMQRLERETIHPQGTT